MRYILGWIATLIFCFPVLTNAAQAQHAQLPPRPCVPIDGCPAADEWYTYRYDNSRTGAQPYASALSDPARVRNLHVVWQYPPDRAGVPGGFKASPIVVNDTVFIGSVNGYFYALDAATGAVKWQYPPSREAGLRGRDPHWSYGFESSASYWPGSPNGAVIFGAQDLSLDPFQPSPPREPPCVPPAFCKPPPPPVGYGSARLFALDAKSGKEIWKSERIATINGYTMGSPSTIGDPKQLHERMMWSSPLIFNNKVYVGTHDFTDTPIQVGRVIAVDLATGRIEPTFHFQAVGTPASLPTVRGGGVWNALATDGTGVYFTTGNTRIPYCSSPYFGPLCPPPIEPEPSPNHGLSMIRVDKDTGNIIWPFQPVPFNRDGDPDWAAGATVMSTSCGELIASVQKDGWSYAVNAGNGVPGLPSMRWQFPPTGLSDSEFLNALHGDDDYRRPGAAWNDVFIVRTGGENLVHNVSANYGKLHALNACAMTENDRVRWIADLGPPYSSGGGYSIGAPTVTGGIVFIGTDRGHLVVLGDPSVVHPVGWRCSNTDITPTLTPQDCTNAGYALVPDLTPLHEVAMPDGGNLAAMRNEPVLARGRVFVATGNGHVYMLEP